MREDRFKTYPLYGAVGTTSKRVNQRELRMNERQHSPSGDSGAFHGVFHTGNTPRGRGQWVGRAFELSVTNELHWWRCPANHDRPLLFVSVLPTPSCLEEECS